MVSIDEISFFICLAIRPTSLSNLADISTVKYLQMKVFVLLEKYGLLESEETNDSSLVVCFWLV
jgi:hypothetical protein